MIDLVLAILKFAGLILSGVFGAYGLLVKFKDDNDRITKSGWRALALIVASTVVGTLSAAFEIYRDSVKQESELEAQTRETLEATNRTERVVAEINRGLQPISNLIVSDWISISTDHIKLKSYIDRFNSELPKAINLLNSSGSFPGYRGGSGYNRNPITIAFDASSKLSPNRVTEELSYNIFAYSDIVLEFFKSPIKPESHHLISGIFDSTPDLKIGFNSGLDIQGMGGNHDIEFSLKTKEFKLMGNMSTDPKYWESTGKIVGVTDLAGSQLFISLPSIMQSGNIEVDKYLPEIRKKFALDALILNFASGRKFWIKYSDIKKLNAKDGFPLYVYTFPNSVGDLNKISR